MKDAEEEKKNGHPAAPLPRELHRTASIFLRNLAPTITKLEVEAVSETLLINALINPQNSESKKLNLRRRIFFRLKFLFFTTL